MSQFTKIKIVYTGYKRVTGEAFLDNLFDSNFEEEFYEFYENVLREVYPIPKGDNILAQLTSVNIFSKLDANSGFWQTPLSKQSGPLTTFITAAIQMMSTPKSISDLRRFMGMVNQLGKFSPRIAEIGKPDLGPRSYSVFADGKEELTRSMVWALYDPDASSFGLGAILLQQHGEEWRPVA